MDIHNDTIIGFGKLKGKKHKELLKSVNQNYKDWIIKQGSEFKYSDTRNYILENCDDGEGIEIQDIIEKLVLYISKNDFSKNNDMKETLLQLSLIINKKFLKKNKL